MVCWVLWGLVERKNCGKTLPPQSRSNRDFILFNILPQNAIFALFYHLIGAEIMSQPFISEITLRNFKRYKDLTVHLKQGINILYGVNSTGKTSILEAINIAAGSFFMKLSGIENRTIELNDIRLESHNGLPYPEYQFPVEIEAQGCVLATEIKWLRALNTISGGTTSIYAKEIAKLSEDAALFVQKGESKPLPIVAYFSTQRLFTARKEARSDSQKQPIGRLSGYYNALNATNTQKHVKAWFKDEEYNQYQKRQTEASYTNEGLEGVKKLILDHFPEWKRIYYFEPETNTRLESGLYIVYQDGQIIPEGLLSDGYRNFLWLLIEIAWRCYTLNPFLGKDVFSKTTGIVTIDEIDLHFHPTWQQRITHILATAFPNIQFVISTHSPIVLGSVKANVLKLEDGIVKNQQNLYGLKPSYVLEVFMETQERLPSLRGDIAKYFKLINEENGKSTEASALRQKLENEMSQDDPMFTEADALIHFLSY